MTYAQIAASWSLWCEYADPDATMAEDEFNALSVDERLALLVLAFGTEQE